MIVITDLGTEHVPPNCSSDSRRIVSNLAWNEWGVETRVSLHTAAMLRQALLPDAVEWADDYASGHLPDAQGELWWVTVRYHAYGAFACIIPAFIGAMENLPFE